MWTMTFSIQHATFSKHIFQFDHIFLITVYLTNRKGQKKEAVVTIHSLKADYYLINSWNASSQTEQVQTTITKNTN